MLPGLVQQKCFRILLHSAVVKACNIHFNTLQMYEASVPDTNKCHTFMLQLFSIYHSKMHLKLCKEKESTKRKECIPQFCVDLKICRQVSRIISQLPPKKETRFFHFASVNLTSVMQYAQQGSRCINLHY